MNTITRLVSLSVVTAALAIGTGCATKVRTVTAEAWGQDGQGVYVAYWEGTCKAILGCDRGDGKVTWCTLDPASNALTCNEQTEVAKVLARKKAKKKK